MSKNYFRKILLSALTVSLLSSGIAGCSNMLGTDGGKNLLRGAVSGSIKTDSAAAENDVENTADAIPEIDKTSPNIEAKDLTIPYGTFLHPAFVKVVVSKSYFFSGNLRKLYFQMV